MKFAAGVRVLGLAAFAATPAPTSAQPAADCSILKGLVTPASGKSTSFRLEPGRGVWLERGRRTKFSRIADSCDLDAGLGISCQWRFGSIAEAYGFFGELRLASRTCLGFNLRDETVSDDPDDGNDWNPIRRGALEAQDGFELEVVEYRATYYVVLGVDPAELNSRENQ